MVAEVVGHRLAEIRRARGLMQQQVADRMGVSKGRISRIERGKISGQDVLVRYATALGGRPTRASIRRHTLFAETVDLGHGAADMIAILHALEARLGQRTNVCR